MTIVCAMLMPIKRQRRENPGNNGILFFKTQDYALREEEESFILT